MKDIIDILSGGHVFFGEYALQAGPNSLPRYLFLKGAVGLLSVTDRPIRILEIGAWAGISTLCWAEGIARAGRHGGTVLCVDPWEGYFDPSQTEQGPRYRTMQRMGETGLIYELFRHNSGFAPDGVQIVPLRGTSRQTLSHLQSDHFDIVYIDGDHRYENVRYDVYEAQRLVREGGLIIGDDLELPYEDVDKKILMRSLDKDYVQDPATGQFYHPGVTLAVHAAFGGIGRLVGLWFIRKTDTGFAPLQAERISPMSPDFFPEPLKAAAVRQLEKFKDSPGNTIAFELP